MKHMPHYQMSEQHYHSLLCKWNNMKLDGKLYCRATLDSSQNLVLISDYTQSNYGWKLSFILFQLADFIRHTVNQLIFAAINFCTLVFMGIFVAIYFHIYWTAEHEYARGQCTACLFGHICGVLFSQFLLFLWKITHKNRMIYSNTCT